MLEKGCAVQPCMLVLYGFVPAIDVTSHFVVNLLEISPVIHHPSSILHKEIKLLLHLQQAVCTPCRPTCLHKVSLGISFCSLL